MEFDAKKAIDDVLKETLSEGKQVPNYEPGIEDKDTSNYVPGVKDKELSFQVKEKAKELINQIKENPGKTSGAVITAIAAGLGAKALVNKMRKSKVPAKKK